MNCYKAASNISGGVLLPLRLILRALHNICALLAFPLRSLCGFKVPDSGLSSDEEEPKGGRKTGRRADGCRSVSNKSAGFGDDAEAYSTRRPAGTNLVDARSRKTHARAWRGTCSQLSDFRCAGCASHTRPDVEVLVGREVMPGVQHLVRSSRQGSS